MVPGLRRWARCRAKRPIPRTRGNIDAEMGPIDETHELPPRPPPALLGILARPVQSSLPLNLNKELPPLPTETVASGHATQLSQGGDPQRSQAPIHTAKLPLNPNVRPTRWLDI